MTVTPPFPLRRSAGRFWPRTGNSRRYAARVPYVIITGWSFPLLDGRPLFLLRGLAVATFLFLWACRGRIARPDRRDAPGGRGDPARS